MTETYWAAEPNSEKCATGALERIRAFRELLKDSGRLGRIKRSWSAFYGYGPNGDRDSSRVTADDNKLQVNVNHYGTLVQQAMVLITGEKPAFKVVAANTDYKSSAQAPLANGLLQYYDDKLGVYDAECAATLSSLLTGEGYVSVAWSPSGGKPYAVDPETNQPVSEGDIDLEWHTPFDVAYDVDTRSWEKLQWIAIRRQANKHDLAVIYPDKAAQIVSRTGENTGDRDDFEFESGRKSSIDTVAYWEVHHLPTKASPNGRMLRFFDASLVLFDSMQLGENGEVEDSGYPYTELPVYRIAPEITLGSNAGHSAFFDVLSLQELIDMTAKIQASAVNSGGLMNYWAPPGSNLSVNQIGDGLNLVESTTKPEVLSMLEIRPEVRNFMELLIQSARQRVAMNDVVMGEPSKGMPAQAMALLHAQALQFHSRLQAAYQHLVARTRTGILRMLKQFAKTERVAQIAGLNNTSALKEFSSKDLSEVDRVTVEAINPASNTFSGRLTMAETLLNKGLVKNPEQYIQLITTGRLEPMYEFANQNLLRLRLEKELLQRGIGLPPRDEAGNLVNDGKTYIVPMKTDPHHTDIPELLAVIQTPEARGNPEIVQAVLGVIEYKLQLWKEVATNEPELAMIMGLPPLPQMGNPNLMAPGGNQGPPQNSASNSDASPPAGDAPKSDVPQLPAGAPPIRLPKPPDDPLTGEKAPPLSMPLRTA